MNYKPLKKNWTPGTFQIGVFIRTPVGNVIETSHDHPGAIVTALVRYSIKDDWTLAEVLEAITKMVKEDNQKIWEDYQKILPRLGG